MVENEFKVMLNEEQYDKIKGLYNWDNEIKQTNYYYDTDNSELNSKRITCRVRKTYDGYFLQMKLPNGKTHSRIEIEKELKDLPETLSGEQLSEFSGGNNLPDVKLLGELTTLRLIKKLDGMEIDLDNSFYFRNTDHELELEFTKNEAAARELFGGLKEKAGIRDNNDICIGKVGRFMKAYKKTRA